MATLIKFGIVGGFGVIWKTVLLLILVEQFKLSENIAIYPTAVLVLLHNYELNRLWTYGGLTPRSWRTFRNYALANATSLIFYFGFFYLLNTQLHYIFASWLAVICAGGLNYAFANRIFRIEKLETD